MSSHFGQHGNVAKGIDLSILEEIVIFTETLSLFQYALFAVIESVTATQLLVLSSFLMKIIRFLPRKNSSSTFQFGFCLVI